MASPESCEQEASLSTCFDTASHTNTSILASKKNSFPPKKMRWIGVVVASQNVAPKAVRALVMFLAIACCQLTVGSSNLSVLAGKFRFLISSVRSSYSHPDLLLTHPTPPHFFRSHRSSTLDFHFLSHYSYIKAIMLYKGNHWTRCAGFMDASWVRLGITNDDLGTSWALPGDNLGMTWG